MCILDIKKIIRSIKIRQYLDKRKQRRNRYSSNYIKSIQPYKYKIGDILFSPDYILKDNNAVESKIWKVKIIAHVDTPENIKQVIGDGYKCKPLNLRQGEYFHNTKFDNSLFKSYSAAFKYLQQRVSFIGRELDYDNWIDHPY